MSLWGSWYIMSLSLAGAGLGLVGVADEINGLAALAVEKFPLHARRESRPAPAFELRLLDLGAELFARALHGLRKRFISAVRDVLFNGGVPAFNIYVAVNYSVFDCRHSATPCMRATRNRPPRWAPRRTARERATRSASIAEIFSINLSASSGATFSKSLSLTCTFAP